MIDLRRLDGMFRDYADDPVKRAEYQRDVSAEKWRVAWERYDQLRFARLCHYLRARQPDAMIGYSILIYRLSAAEIADATGDSLPAWSKAIERSVQAGH